ncbi:hypothetical protein [Oceanisphaera marina]|nr:hypothetical protein [Oceanisphaera marina]
MNETWVTLTSMISSEQALTHLQELKQVAPEPPGGGRYRVIKKLHMDSGPNIYPFYCRVS